MIAETKKVLVKVDQEVVKRNLAAALAADKAQARKNSEETALARELERQERAKKVAEAKAAAEHAKAEAERAKAATQKVRDGEARRRKQKSPEERARRQKRALTSNISEAELVALGERFRKADAMCEAGEKQWVEGTIAKALILCAVRDKFPSHQEFGEWCFRHLTKTNSDDRAALVNLGRLGEDYLRGLLVRCNSRSYQHIWRQHNKPALEVVG